MNSVPSISVVAALLAFVTGAPAFAAQARTEVTPRRGHVGEVFTLKIHVDREEGDRVTLPRKASFRPFEVVRRRLATKVEGRRVRETLEVDLMVFETGDQVIPSVELRVYDRGGRISNLSTDPATVHVASVLGNEPNAKRKGNHGPVGVFERDYTWLWVLGGLVVFGLQFLLLRWAMKRRAMLAPLPVEIVRRPPWEIAMEKLRGIERSRLPDKGLVKEHYDGVSDAVREYLGALGGFPGLDSTTQEVLDHFSAETPRGVDLSTVQVFFGECDLVKFAKWSPGADGPRELLAMAVQVVEKSRAAQMAPPPDQPVVPPPSGPFRAPPEVRP